MCIRDRDRHYDIAWCGLGHGADPDVLTDVEVWLPAGTFLYDVLYYTTADGEEVRREVYPDKNGTMITLDGEILADSIRPVSYTHLPRRRSATPMWRRCSGASKGFPRGGRLRLSKKVCSPLGPLCEGAPPSGGGGENCAVARNISGYGKVLSLRPFGAPPSQRKVFRHADLPPRGKASQPK